ncbi:hypothetical protein BGZ46_000016 [Entomortierella lignicola]|nr:hypothetical protein BGZ46_000016 [Entomortierella lignicola]
MAGVSSLGGLINGLLSSCGLLGNGILGNGVLGNDLLGRLLNPGTGKGSADNTSLGSIFGGISGGGTGNPPTNVCNCPNSTPTPSSGIFGGGIKINITSKPTTTGAFSTCIATDNYVKSTVTDASNQAIKNDNAKSTTSYSIGIDKVIIPTTPINGRGGGERGFFGGTISSIFDGNSGSTISTKMIATSEAKPATTTSVDRKI